MTTKRVILNPDRFEPFPDGFVIQREEPLRSESRGVCRDVTGSSAPVCHRNGMSSSFNLSDPMALVTRPTCRCGLLKQLLGRRTCARR